MMNIDAEGDEQQHDDSRIHGGDRSSRLITMQFG